MFLDILTIYNKCGNNVVHPIAMRSFHCAKPFVTITDDRACECENCTQMFCMWSSIFYHSKDCSMKFLHLWMMYVFILDIGIDTRSRAIIGIVICGLCIWLVWHLIDFQSSYSLLNIECCNRSLSAWLRKPTSLNIIVIPFQCFE